MESMWNEHGTAAIMPSECKQMSVWCEHHANDMLKALFTTMASIMGILPTVLQRVLKKWRVTGLPEG